MARNDMSICVDRHVKEELRKRVGREAGMEQDLLTGFISKKDSKTGKEYDESKLDHMRDHCRISYPYTNSIDHG